MIQNSIYCLDSEMACYNKLGKCLVAGKDIKPGEQCSMDILEVKISKDSLSISH